jgi:hypothetical protein
VGRGEIFLLAFLFAGVLEAASHLALAWLAVGQGLS